MFDEGPPKDGEELAPAATGDAPEGTDLLAAARQERPRAELAEYVLSEVSQRQRHFEARPRHFSLREPRLTIALVVATSSLMAAAAAAAVLILRPGARSATSMASAEPVASAVGSSSTAAAAIPSVQDPCRQRVVAAGRQPMIDDFEDGDDAILPLESRLGLWRWVRDTDRPGTAPALLPIPQIGLRSASKQAVHVKGARLLDWGASVEFTFQPACYDASAYQGISLRAKGPGRIYLAARETRLIPTDGGGACQGNDCYNVHVKKFDLPAHYVTIQARWFELQQRGYGRPPVDPTQLHSIAIQVHPEDTPYDLWIDDVRFID